MNRQRQHTAVSVRRSNSFDDPTLKDLWQKAADPIAALTKAGVPEKELKQEIRDAVAIFRHRKQMKGPFVMLWGLPNRRSLTQLVLDLRLKAGQIEQLSRAVAGSQMHSTFPWMDGSTGRRDWRILERTKWAVPEILRAYASCIYLCHSAFQRKNRLKSFYPEALFEQRLVSLVEEKTGTPRWGNVSALLFYVYEVSGIKRKTDQEAVRKRLSRSTRKLLSKRTFRALRKS